jgi:hypothetical protein
MTEPPIGGIDTSVPAEGTPQDQFDATNQSVLVTPSQFVVGHGEQEFTFTNTPAEAGEEHPLTVDITV